MAKATFYFVADEDQEPIIFEMEGPMKKLLANPTTRLVVRALLAGLAVFVAKLQAGGDLDWTLLAAAATSGGWAALEAFTPLNSLVGYLKHP